jgi:hypothetical protein
MEATMGTDAYRILPFWGDAKQLEGELNKRQSQGWECVTILPYKPDASDQPLEWQPHLVLRRREPPSIGGGSHLASPPHTPIAGTLLVRNYGEAVYHLAADQAHEVSPARCGAQHFDSWWGIERTAIDSDVIDVCPACLDKLTHAHA